ncbi:MAG: phosphoglucosamine mutase [Phycisphaerales bacterium]|nr:phosphoglucosamine mutase [Phycisphaerales bacterium]
MALMVGVSGIRGLVGETLTPSLVLEFSQAYATALSGSQYLVARDSRSSGEMYASIVAAGLAACGAAVTDLGIAMTPTAAYAIRSGGFSGGIVITASHNPPQWNGLKFLDENGLGPDPARVAAVSEVRANGDYVLVKSGFQPIRRDHDAGKRHVEAVLGLIEVDLASLRGTRVVLDSVNGAGGVVTPAFFDALGCELTHINAAPNGQFAHPPEPIEENLGQLGEAVRSAGASVGFAQDPDADRLVVLDEKGGYIGEEFTLALAVWSVLSRRPGDVAANLSTSRMIDDIAARFGRKVMRTPVGESHVARAILKQGCVVGGEGNGGVIDPRISPVRDSLSGISQVLQLMSATRKPLSALVAELPRYVMIKQKYEATRERIDAAVGAIRASFTGEKVDACDGVRVDFAEGWVHVRPSNTEPIVRMIAEARDATSARRLLDRVKAAGKL